MQIARSLILCLVLFCFGVFFGLQRRTCVCTARFGTWTITSKSTFWFLFLCCSLAQVKSRTLYTLHSFPEICTSKFFIKSPWTKLLYFNMASSDWSFMFKFDLETLSVRPSRAVRNWLGGCRAILRGSATQVPWREPSLISLDRCCPAWDTTPAAGGPGSTPRTTAFFCSKHRKRKIYEKKRRSKMNWEGKMQHTLNTGCQRSHYLTAWFKISGPFVLLSA